MDLYNVLDVPLLTEKSEEIKGSKSGSNRYVFRVLPKVRKETIRQALYSIYGVKAIKINTSIMAGKKKRFRTGRVKQPSWKKAIVTLSPKEEIDFSAKQKGKQKR